MQANRLSSVIPELRSLLDDKKALRKDPSHVATMITNIKKAMQNDAEIDRFTKYLSEQITIKRRETLASYAYE